MFAVEEMLSRQTKHVIQFFEENGKGELYVEYQH